MHRFLARGVVALSAGLGTAAVAADPPAPDRPPTESRSFFARLNPFGGGDDAPRPDPGPRVRLQPVGPLSAERMVTALQAEKDAYTRRLDVCLRLREIALERKDEKLEVAVNELEKQATATYQARVARLGVQSGGPLPALPTPSAEVLDRTLGSGVAVTPLTGGKKAGEADKAATAKVNQFKEVKQ